MIRTACAFVLAAAMALLAWPFPATAQPRPPAPAPVARSAPRVLDTVRASDSVRAAGLARGADSVRAADSAAAAPVRPAPVRPVLHGPVRGVTWRAPASDAAARADLRRVRTAGFNAVRTGVPTPAVLAEADALGLAVYAELDLDYATADRLREAHPTLVRQIAGLGRLAARYPALTHVGLARRPNTADAATCPRLRTFARAARQAGLTPYVVAAFDAPSVAACADVSLVLVDRLGALSSGPPWPVQLPTTDATSPVALGYLVGAPVRAGRYGVEQPGSTARQARVVAEALRVQAAPVFVVQWRDDAPLGLDQPRGDALGLLDEKGQPRLAFAQAQDVLTGQRDAFAYAGRPRPAPSRGAPVLWLWTSLALLGAVFATEPRLRTILPRFLRSPSFFRDSVRDARGTMVGATLVQWIGVALAVGVFVAVLVRAMREGPAFAALLALLPGLLGRGLAGVTQYAALTVPLVAVGFAVMSGLWAYAYVLAARRRYHLSVWQAIMLIVWHRWPHVLLALGAVAFLTPGTSAATVVLWIVAFVAVELWGALRSALDLTLMTRLPAAFGVLLFLLPALLAAALVAGLLGFDALAFVAALATA